MKKYRAAIVGTGGIAAAHVKGVAQSSERLELVAAVDVDEAKLDAFCQLHEIPHRYTDLEQMLQAQHPDLVHICTPPGTHCDLTIGALEQGAWVYCEKPLCASLAQLDRIEQVEQASQCFCSSVFQMRFGSGSQHLKQLIDQQAMGRVLVGQCATTWYRGHDYYAVPWRGSWETELGGPTMIHGIHTMDLLLWLMGDWQQISAMIATLDRRIDVEDVSMALVQFENQAMVSVINSVLSPREETYLRLDFQKATVEARYLYRYRNSDWTYTQATCAEDEEFEAWQSLPPEIEPTHGAQIASLIQCMDHHERPRASGDEARRTIEFLSALYKSAMTGQTVKRGTIKPGDPFYQSISGQTHSIEQTTEHTEKYTA